MEKSKKTKMSNYYMVEEYIKSRSNSDDFYNNLCKDNQFFSVIHHSSENLIEIKFSDEMKKLIDNNNILFVVKYKCIKL